ncbi:MAG: biotin transporter BioY [Saprospiraceae bacterium]
MSHHLFIQVIITLLFVALFAQLSIDVPVGESSIPITGQTFAVLLSAYWLGRKMGTMVILTYVLLGVIGFPIFADGKSGWSVLMGGSGGFLIGFIVAAYVVGYLGEKDWPFSFIKSLIAMTLGTVIILFFGVGRLTNLYDLEKGLAYGFYPFWKGAILKIILGATIIPLYYQLKK